MKLNLGSGQYKLPGYVNVDSQPASEPDVLWDLEKTPWPFETNAAQEVVLTHVLEHLGRETSVYFAILKELYRVCAPNAQVVITVPHPRHDTFLVDPTHVRAILPESMMMLSKARNLEWKQKGIADTPLALYLDVDFEVTKVTHRFDPMFQSQVDAGKMKYDEVLGTARVYCNVIKETEIVMRASK